MESRTWTALSPSPTFPDAHALLLRHATSTHVAEVADALLFRQISSITVSLVGFMISWYYGPTAWDREDGHMWHYDCPDTEGKGHDGQVMYWKDGAASCMGCDASEEPADDA